MGQREAYVFRARWISSRHDGVSRIDSRGRRDRKRRGTGFVRRARRRGFLRALPAWKADRDDARLRGARTSCRSLTRRSRARSSSRKMRTTKVKSSRSSAPLRPAKRISRSRSPRSRRRNHQRRQRSDLSALRRRLRQTLRRGTRAGEASLDRRDRAARRDRPRNSASSLDRAPKKSPCVEKFRSVRRHVFAAKSLFFWPRGSTRKHRHSRAPSPLRRRTRSRCASSHARGRGRRICGAPSSE